MATGDVTEALRERVCKDGRRVVVLDDDPTGTQCATGVDVVLTPSMEAIRDFFRSGSKSLYMLTNTRALSREEAVATVREIKDWLAQAGAETGNDSCIVLRGDSTLRGHVFAEIDAVAEGGAVALFVPALPDVGRVTVGGVHYCTVDGRRVPVAATEFARDATFGYGSRRMVEWVAEVGQGRRGVSVPLEVARQGGPGVIAGALATAPRGAVVVPDAETEEDIARAVLGLLEAEAGGQEVVVRSAATFAALRAGVRSQGPVAWQGKVDGTLIVCGSHTEAATRQLDALRRLGHEIVVLPTELALHEAPEQVAERVAPIVRAQLDGYGVAVLATERKRREADNSLETGAQVMNALVRTVREVWDRRDVEGSVIVKGGITSAEVAREGLGATKARVEGQVLPGISLWMLKRPHLPGVPYVVVPGNVGEDGTLVRLMGAC